MTNLNNDILFKILEYSSNKKIIYIDKSFYNYMKETKKIFYDNLKDFPITIKYKLTRWKEKVEYTIKCRPSMYVEEEKSFIVNQTNFGINLGKIIQYNHNLIKKTKQFEDILVPTSYFREAHNNNSSGYVIYWTLYKIWSDDIKRIYQYHLINF